MKNVLLFTFLLFLSTPVLAGNERESKLDSKLEYLNSQLKLIINPTPQKGKEFTGTSTTAIKIDGIGLVVASSVHCDLTNASLSLVTNRDEKFSRFLLDILGRIEPLELGEEFILWIRLGDMIRPSGYVYKGVCVKVPYSAYVNYVKSSEAARNFMSSVTVHQTESKFSCVIKE